VRANVVESIPRQASGRHAAAVPQSPRPAPDPLRGAAHPGQTYGCRCPLRADTGAQTRPSPRAAPQRCLAFLAGRCRSGHDRALAGSCQRLDDQHLCRSRLGIETPSREQCQTAPEHRTCLWNLAHQCRPPELVGQPVGSRGDHPVMWSCEPLKLRMASDLRKQLHITGNSTL